MPSPFPGMNPYLEHPALWPEVHSRLIVALADALNPQILPKYRAAIDQRIYSIDGSDALLVGIPDVTVERRAGTASTARGSTLGQPAIATVPLQVTVPMPIEIREQYLEIREVASQTVVTAVELLSPSNKRTRQGRAAYEEKRLRILGSRTHLVEIDLLRSGEPMAVLDSQGEFDYRILVSRGDQRPRAELYGFAVTDAIPAFSLPLKVPDDEPVVDLNVLIHQLYERGGYDVVIDYSLAPSPALGPELAAWLDNLCKERGLR
jgi:Protein of unknown function (DUF4058)